MVARHRPISLLSGFNRIFKKLMYNRLKAYLYKQGIFVNHSQHVIFDIVSQIQTNMDHKLYSCDIFADLRKASIIACKQALLFGQAKRASRERASEGPRKGELATISHKFSFPPRKSRDSAKRENCHRKRAAD